jgi:arabinogalactan endo-1,4-beta-galactosidase
MHRKFIVFALALCLFACLKPSGAQEYFFAKGADIGWLSEMEAAGITFKDPSGKKGDCISILKGLGMNTIRLRVWVDPANGWSGEADVVKLAMRAKDQGMRLMINFHYSDWWADPGKQNKPAAWKNLSVAQLTAAIHDHTKKVLTALKDKGISPEWVQVGNETNDGMLWEEGRASKHMDQFAAMVNAGYAAVKLVSPASKVIVHISNGYNNEMFRWMFDGLTAHGAKYDVIGMSLYPEPEKWREKNAQCLANMKDMIARYNKEVMICEVGMPTDQAEACKLFIADLISKLRSLPDRKGLGVLYWEPQAHNNWKGYKLGAFDDSGKPTMALDAFR